jgi:RNA polymerase sigma-70 factor (ECF subfamily)
MTWHDKAEDERVRRFREVALPCLDDAYTLACFLTRNRVDAEDAVQECYRRALRDFDSSRGSAIKPRLLAIVRDVCHFEFAKRGQETADDPGDRETIRWRIRSLPQPCREAIVLREFNGLSYREIAEVAGVSVGTVLSRLSQARALLLVEWRAEAFVSRQRIGPGRPQRLSPSPARFQTT